MMVILQQLLCHFLLLVCASAVEKQNLKTDDVNPVQNRNINDLEIQEAAQFALGHLQTISDSGIYRTLSLKAIEHASSQEGVFHFNIFLKLHFSSPHFKSNRPTESFDVIVMKNLKDDSRSFAIDEFPEMDEKAIERYWIQMVEEHRRKRQALFDEMTSNKNDSAFSYEMLLKKSTRELRVLLRDKKKAELRKMIEDILEERWNQLEISELKKDGGNAKDEL